MNDCICIDVGVEDDERDCGNVVMRISQEYSKCDVDESINERKIAMYLRKILYHLRLSERATQEDIRELEKKKCLKKLEKLERYIYDFNEMDKDRLIVDICKEYPNLLNGKIYSLKYLRKLINSNL